MSALPAIMTETMPRALLLSDGELSPADQNVQALLDFFGIRWEVATIGQVAGNGALSDTTDSATRCILSSAPVMAETLQSLSAHGDPLSWLAKNAGSVYVYDFQEAELCKRLLKFLTSDLNADIRPFRSTPTILSVTGDFPEMCGPMSGLRVPVTPSEADQAFALSADGDTVHPIISTNAGAVFARLVCRGVPFYLNACRSTIDIRSHSAEYFDVKKCFCSAVPITMYLKWMFADVCWQNAETSACLIVDDPLLRPRYGFLHFRRALELMDQHNFTMSLAFIPWNWHRTHPAVVNLFQNRSDRFSLSIHGCDHTAGEFATQSADELNAKAKIASQRMRSLEQRTSLMHARIMIFPQGTFSAETGRVLKLNGFVAAVNTEVAPSGDSGNRTTIADLWDVAINKYGTFPIFTRRYPTHGVENVAFDTLLGKPCFIVAHHQEFKDGGRNLAEFIDRLNSLSCKLVWRNLGDAVSRSFRVRSQPDGTSILQMFGNRVCVNNSSVERRTIEVIKEESDSDCLSAVMVNQEKIPWNCEGGRLRFSVSVPPKATAEVRVLYADNLGDGSYPNGIRYRVRTGLRRYLSETRDQYVSQSDFLNDSATRVWRLLK